jgi:hypothetical protein
VPSQPRPTHVSFYRGRDPAQWHEQVPVFRTLRYTDLLPGVDLEITGQNGQILLQATAPLDMEISDGKSAPDAAPRAMTLQPGHPTPLEPLLNPTLAGQPSPARPTTPDGAPLLFGTFLGSDGLDQAHAIVTDDLGRIYLTGQMLPIPLQLAPATPLHAVESFFARFTADGSAVEYLTIILGDVEDWGKAVVVSSDDEAYFTGETDSSDFPTTAGAYDQEENGSFDAFLVKLDAEGLVAYSTLLGSTQWDTATSVAIDDTGAAYLTGDTWSETFPTPNNALDSTLDGPRDVFVAKISPEGSQLLYSTFLGGENIERAEAMVVSAPDVVTLVGWTTSGDFPTTANAYDPTYNNAVDAFVAQLMLGNSSLTDGTFLGGSGEDRAYALALDADGNAFLAGMTASSNFPATAGAYDTTWAGGPPAMAYPARTPSPRASLPMGNRWITPPFWAIRSGIRPTGLR